MLSSNQYITLTTSIVKPTLNTVDLVIEVTKNNPYYFNSDGIYLRAYRTVDATPITESVIWKPYKMGGQDKPAYLEGDYTVLETSKLYILVPKIVLRERDTEDRRMVDDVTVEVFYYLNGIKTPLFTHREFLKSIQLPLPRIHSFTATHISTYSQKELDEDVAKVTVSWRGIIPHYEDNQFYHLEVLCDYLPGREIFQGNRAEYAAYSFVYTPPVIARGEIVTFTLNIYALQPSGKKHIYITKQVQIRMPRQRYKHVYAKKGSVIAVRTIYAKKGTFRQVKSVSMKYGGQWYTE